MQPSSTRSWPRVVRLLVVLTMSNALRLVGFAYAAAALSGAVPLSGVFGGVGDGVAGIGAVVVSVLLLRRRTWGTWVAAIAWNVYALTDVVFANAINAFAPDAEPFPPVVLLLPLYFTIAHVISLRVLLRPETREHFGVLTR